MPDTGYEIRRRRWPWPRTPLKRPWELIRRSDMKPVGFYRTQVAAENALEAVKTAQQNAR